MAPRRWDGAKSFEQLSQVEREKIRQELGVRRAPTSVSQPKNASLTEIAGLAKTDGNVIVANGSSWVAESGETARASLGLGSIATEDAGDFHPAMTAQAAIEDPTGGTTEDAEARAAIVSILEALRTLGLIAT